MPTDPLKDNIAALVAQHGASAVKAAVAAHGIAPGKQAAGEYITSIVKGDQGFDESVLHRVTNVLSTGAKTAKVG